MSDPYAGVFFSKDRIEPVIESTSDPRYVELPLPKGGFGAPLRVRTLSQGEWMSGCPEEGQSYGTTRSLTVQANKVICSNYTIFSRRMCHAPRGVATHFLVPPMTSFFST
jgi:hypothetical protein